MLTLPILSQTPDPRIAWLPVAILILIGLVFVVSTLILSAVVGPSRTGPGKAITYESGVMPVGDARRRFNVRFYLMAMIFLVFDVEIVFFYPWATLFPESVVRAGDSLPKAGLLLIEMSIFVLILLIAYIYAWAKGIFRWD
jgi:NADH-quinone oxidoreductase subunit A